MMRDRVVNTPTSLPSPSPSYLTVYSIPPAMDLRAWVSDNAMKVRAKATCVLLLHSTAVSLTGCCVSLSPSFPQLLGMSERNLVDYVIAIGKSWHTCCSLTSTFCAATC